MKTETMMKSVLMAALFAAATLTAMPAAAMDADQEIAAQGRAALAAMQMDLRAGFARPAAAPVDRDALVVRDAIRAQGHDALRAIAWENESSLHAQTLTAGVRGEPARRGRVTVTAAAPFEFAGVGSN